jgi:putative transposase
VPVAMSREMFVQQGSHLHSLQLDPQQGNIIDAFMRNAQVFAHPQSLPHFSKTAQGNERTMRMCIEIPPKHAVASIIGFLKGKSAVAIARQFGGKLKNFTGEHCWARGYAVSTLGYELERVKRYIREQEAEDQAGRTYAQGG